MYDSQGFGGDIPADLINTINKIIKEDSAGDGEGEKKEDEVDAPADKSDLYVTPKGQEVYINPEITPAEYQSKDTLTPAKKTIDNRVVKGTTGT